MRLKIYRKFLKLITWLFFDRTYSYLINHGELFLVDTTVNVEIKRKDGYVEQITK